MWILLSIFPELSSDGEVIEIIGCFTDIRYVSIRAEWPMIGLRSFVARNLWKCA
jgi:hypothetical protein